jgi:tRNA(Ile)-lysidine synthase
LNQGLNNQGLNQAWREDSSNRDLAHTRNRIRHELLPLLSGFNPEIRRQLSRMAGISLSEESYWQGELSRLLPSLLLPGRPTRGGGRSTSTHPQEASAAIEIERLKQLHPAVGRRVLREAARQLGATLNFDHTERLLALAGTASRTHGRRVELPGGVIAERTMRELRLSRSASEPETQEYRFLLPGEIDAPRFGLCLHAELAPGGQACSATLRAWRAGDRVQLPHSRGAKKVTEVLDRLHAVGADRKTWPVLEAAGKIVWMRGVEVDAPEFVITTLPLAF